MKIFSSLILSLFLATTLACGDDDHDDSGHEQPAECDAIGEACHDSTTVLGIECHENAHGTWTADQCIENQAACLAECADPSLVDAGPGDAAPTADAPPSS